MKCHHAMECLSQEVREGSLDDPNALPQKLLALLNGDFVQQDECVFLTLLKKAAQVTRMDFPDRTNYECSVNHIHVEDYLGKQRACAAGDVGPRPRIRAGDQESAFALPGTKHFQVIVAFQGLSCTVRFHTIRSDEEWVDKDAGRFGSEAVAVLDTREMDI